MNNLFIPFTQRFAKYNVRSQKAIKHVAFSLSLRGISILISFAMIPLLLKNLSPATYGVWLTLISLVNILSFTNAGLGNGLKNLLTEEIAKKNTLVINELISTAYIAIFSICGLVFAMFVIVNPYLHWDEILNAPVEMRTQLGQLVLLVVFFFLLQLILNLITSIFYSYQKSSMPDFINLLGQVLAFVGVLVVSHLGLTDLLLYGVIISAMPVISLLLVTIVVFRRKYLPITFSFAYFNKIYLRNLCSLGGKFFLIQFTAYLLYQSNNMIISHTSGTLDVTIYNIAYKYAGATQLIFTIILSPIWAASTDALVKKEFQWIKNTVKALNKIWLFLVFVCLLQIIFSQQVYALWVGKEISISWVITTLLVVYFILSMQAGIYCYIINGSGKVFMQFLLYILQVVIHIPLAICLGRTFGVKGVLMSMCAVMLINIVWMKKQYNLIINQKLHGLWNK